MGNLTCRRSEVIASSLPIFRHVVADLLGLEGISDVEQAEPGREVGHRDDLGQFTVVWLVLIVVLVMGSEPSTALVVGRVRCIGTRPGHRQAADDLRAAWDMPSNPGSPSAETSTRNAKFNGSPPSNGEASRMASLFAKTSSDSGIRTAEWTETAPQIPEVDAAH